MTPNQDRRIAEFARSMATYFANGDNGTAKSAFANIVQHEPLAALQAITRMNDEYGFIGEGAERQRRPFAEGEMDIIRDSINRIANNLRYELNDSVGNEALRDAVCSTLLRALVTDPTATLDIGAAGERQTDNQVANSALMAKGPAQAIAGTISLLFHPEHRLDISERLLVWGDENTGSLPDAFRRRMLRVNVEAHEELRQRDIKLIMAEAEADGRVRPAQSRYQRARAQGWNGQS